jgi:hypothetical protein
MKIRRNDRIIWRIDGMKHEKGLDLSAGDAARRFVASGGRTSKGQGAASG